MSNAKGLVLSLFILSAKVIELWSLKTESHCYAVDWNPYLMFGQKTPYAPLYDRAGITPLQGCTVERLVVITRHGTRRMTNKEYEGFYDKLDRLRQGILARHNDQKGRLCFLDAENLRRWTLDVAASEAGHLAPQGRRDMVELAQRLARYFPRQLRGPYSPERHLIRHTDKRRVEESAECFAMGLFGEQFDVQSLPKPIKNADPILCPFKTCPLWNEVDEQGDRQVDSFNAGPEMQELLDDVSTRLGLGEHDRRLTIADIMMMYNACGYQKAWQLAELSPWCAVFTKRELQVLEYAVDLKEYYRSGPGNPINARLGCPLLKDIVNKFREVERADVAMGRKVPVPPAVIYLTHDFMLQMLYAVMGVTNADSPLLSDNMGSQADRSFRVSILTPYAGNLVVVLYRCLSTDPLQVVFYRNERVLPLALPGCNPRDGRCPWRAVQDAFRRLVDDPACEDMSFCRLANGAANVAASVGLVAVLANYALLHLVGWHPLL